jgi:DNA-directed RNA polymerase subunit RPC12/RpoP
MPRYICQKITCPNHNGFDATTMPPQCPKCKSKVFLAPVQAAKRAVERMVPVGGTPNDGFTAVVGTALADCEALILAFDVTSTTTAEAKKTKDYVVTLGTNSKRIDRQGPVTTYPTVHARYAVQLGTQVNAGIHMEADVDFTAAFVRRALTLSLNEHRYYRIYVEMV